MLVSFARCKWQHGSCVETNQNEVGCKWCFSSGNMEVLWCMQTNAWYWTMCMWLVINPQTWMHTRFQKYGVIKIAPHKLTLYEGNAFFYFWNQPWKRKRQWMAPLTCHYMHQKAPNVAKMGFHNIHYLGLPPSPNLWLLFMGWWHGTWHQSNSLQPHGMNSGVLNNTSTCISHASLCQKAWAPSKFQ